MPGTVMWMDFPTSGAATSMDFISHPLPGPTGIGILERERQGQPPSGHTIQI